MTSRNLRGGMAMASDVISPFVAGLVIGYFARWFVDVSEAFKRWVIRKME